MPLLIENLGFNKGDIGLLSSCFAIAYGSSKFLSGVIADRSNPRIFMSLGLIMTGVLNILFGFSSSLSLLALLWGLNGLFQGWGWPPCAKLLTHWYSQKERGVWWGMWNSSHNVGGALIPLLVGIVGHMWGWRYGMFVPGIFCIVVGVFIFFCLRDTPASLGLPPIEKYKGESLSVEKAEKLPSLRELLVKYIFNNRYLWMLGIAYFFVYLIRGAINDWSALFLMETRHYDLIMANGAILWFEIGGLIGGLAAGWFSDKICDGRRGPVNVICVVAVIVFLLMLWILPPTLVIVDYALIFMIGFLIFGPQMLIGMAGAELAHKQAAGSATGFIGWIAYIGMAVSGYPLSMVIEWAGWTGFFITLSICSLVASGILLPLWSVRSNSKLESDSDLSSIKISMKKA